MIWNGVRSQPFVVFTSIRRVRPSGEKLAMSYPAPSPSSSDTHLTCFARSERPFRDQGCFLMGERAFLPSAPQGTVPLIPPRRIELSVRPPACDRVHSGAARC